MSLKATVHDGIEAIGRTVWDACAAPMGDPFVSYDFLHACEASGSAAPAQGWAPRHLVLTREDGATAGVMPLYLKGHSQGEYVFDHAWADADERAGGRYYPKLLSAVPFTPVTGPRLMAAPDVPADVAGGALMDAAVTLALRLGVSSLHVNFPIEDEVGRMTGAVLLPRLDMQYVWRNRGYAGFDDFLADLSSGRRKTIRRERREAQAGLDIRALTGADLTPAIWDAFFGFYLDTGGRKWGRPYLTRDFFARIGETMADRIVMMTAFRGATPIAGALNFIGRDALYGRQWGATEDRPFLHFELCYYQAIDFAIRQGLSRVEAGAQGELKIARGYLPEKVRSAHWIAHPVLRRAVADYLDHERPAVEAEIEAIATALSPYRCD